MENFDLILSQAETTTGRKPYPDKPKEQDPPLQSASKYLIRKSGCYSVFNKQYPQRLMKTSSQYEPIGCPILWLSRIYSFICAGTTQIT